MPSRTSQIAQVGKRKVELSNLQKVLYPDDHIVKAQLIEYYFKLAPTILAHLKGRPLSVVRYPDGIGGESFFQKATPKWAPEWIETVTLGEEKKNYVIATEAASLWRRADRALHGVRARSRTGFGFCDPQARPATAPAPRADARTRARPRRARLELAFPAVARGRRLDLTRP